MLYIRYLSVECKFFCTLPTVLNVSKVWKLHNKGTARREDGPIAEPPGPAERNLRQAYSPKVVPAHRTTD